MERIRSVIVLCCLFSLITASCSVKEDRSLCPCHLSLDLGGVVSGTEVGLDFSSADGFFHSTSVVVGEEKVFSFDVPRTELTILAYYGDDGLLDGPQGLRIPEHRQCPAIYLDALRTDTHTEYLIVDLLPRKSYCNINVSFEDVINYRYSASIEGEICGYTADGKIRRGKFSSMLEPDADGNCSARVPRQDDASLYLQIVDRNGYVKNFALGEYILESGFDWKRPDLEDVIVEIDYARTEVVFRINGWEKSVSFDVEI